jgi:soluble lytic murein transglycosylase-like protein
MKRLFSISACILTLLAHFPAIAGCWDEAARIHSVDPVLLRSIGWQESRGKPNAIGPKLPDGNRAIGLMQINTIHLPTLKRNNITYEDLFEPCTSIKVGAWVLRDCINKFGETWRAVGCYYAGPNSKAHSAQASYVADVQRHYAGYSRQLFAQSSSTTQTLQAK